MTDGQTIIVINKEELLSSVKQKQEAGFRFVQIGCTKTGENSYELNYSFDLNYQFENLRVVATSDDVIDSIQKIYSAGFIYENELAELFDIKFSDMLIDFKGKLYKTSVEAPFK